MTERERLINLLQNVPADFEGNRGVGTIADFLLENGVIVPVIKEGDTRYAIAYTADTRVIEVQITEINRDGSVIRVESVANPLHFWFLASKDFYKWSNFKTREEAEKALKESEDNA